MKKIASLAVLLSLMLGVLAIFYIIPDHVESRVQRVLDELPWVVDHSLGDVDYSVLSRRLTINDLKLKIQSPHIETLFVRRLELEDPQNWEPTLLPDRNLETSPKLPDNAFLQHARIVGLELGFNKRRLTLERMELDQVRISSSLPPQPSADLQSNEVFFWMSQLLDGIELNRLEAKKLLLTGSESELMDISLASIELTGLKKGNADGIRLDHIRAVSPQELSDLKIGRFSAKQARLSLWCDLFYPQTARDNQKAPKLEKLADTIVFSLFSVSTPDEILSIGEVNIAQPALHTDILRAAWDPEIQSRFAKDPLAFYGTGPVHLKGIQVKGKDNKYILGIVRASANETNHWKRASTESKVEIVGLELYPSGLNKSTQSKLNQLGYDRLIFNLSIESKYDQAKNVFTLRRLFFGMDQGFELNLSLTVQGLNLNTLGDNRDAITDLVSSARLSQAEIQYQDLSFAPRLIQMLEDQWPTEVSLVREQLINMLYQLKLKGQKVGAQRAIEAVESLLTFIDQPGKITLSINPHPPVSLLYGLAAMEAEPGLIAERLNWRIKATPGKSPAQVALQKKNMAEPPNPKSKGGPSEPTPQVAMQKRSIAKPLNRGLKETPSKSPPPSSVKEKRKTEPLNREAKETLGQPTRQETVRQHSGQYQHPSQPSTRKAQRSFVFGGKKLTVTHEPQEGNPWPGRIIGTLAASEQKIFYSNWKYRPLCFELVIGARKHLARMIFSIARFSEDVDQSMTLARFERGAQAFHYTVPQIVDWANAVESRKVTLSTPEELELLTILISDGVLVKTNGEYTSSGLVSHVLGAAAGKRRSLARNINQERWHVMWDESPLFRKESIASWRALTAEQKRLVLKKLKGYNHENELQIIEEWAAWGRENDPVK